MIFLDSELTEAERFPLLTPSGRGFLRAMRQHANAPIWNWPNGEQLDERGLAAVRSYARRLESEKLFGPNEHPVWLLMVQTIHQPAIFCQHVFEQSIGVLKTLHFDHF